MGSYLRYHRKKSGLTQSELAEVLGSIGSRQVARHENFKATPSIYVALGYHIALQASIAELFPGVYETVRQGIEQRLLDLEHRLQQSSVKGRRAAEIARKLEWLEQRRSHNAL